jgi:hypothetical protein
METLFICSALVASIYLAQRGAVNIILALRGASPARKTRARTREFLSDHPQETYDGPLATVIPLFKSFAPKENDMTIDINPEVQGLQQAIDHAQLMVDACTELGTPGGEAFLAHLEDSDNGERTLDAAYQIQTAFDDALPAAQQLLDLLTNQLTVKDASDAVGGEHGSKSFLSGND